MQTNAEDTARIRSTRMFRRQYGDGEHCYDTGRPPGDVRKGGAAAVALPEMGNRISGADVEKIAGNR